jgi:hypothetical protein
MRERIEKLLQSQAGNDLPRGAVESTAIGISRVPKVPRLVS